ncbi:GNAT family protein [Streptomyces sp. NPDC048442]|uniref:GNAT family N-acetyltransferase n=1 Tax=Streptomyces sp. NPDC048442 TaxID=3154823 RepID=UPI00343A0E9F
MNAPTGPGGLDEALATRDQDLSVRDQDLAVGDQALSVRAQPCRAAPLIETPRLLLRHFAPHDAAPLRAYRSDPVVARYQVWRSPLSEQDAAEQVLRYASERPVDPGWFHYAVEHRGEGVLVGDLAVWLDDNLRQAEVGFTLAPAHQRRGYGTEMVTALLDHLFLDRGLHRVSAECDTRNTPSATLLERVGFRREGLRPEFSLNPRTGQWTDTLIYGLLRRQYTAARAPRR